MSKKKHQPKKVTMSNENNAAEDVKDGPSDETQAEQSGAGDNAQEGQETGTQDQSNEASGTDAPADQTPPAETAPPVLAGGPPVKTVESVATMADTMIAPELRSDFNLLNEQFDRYLENMAVSRPISEEDGVRQQINLWRLINSVLLREGQAFTVLFSQLLSRMNDARKDVLGEKDRYRFFGALPMGAEENRNFESILSALMRLCNPQTRTLAMKQVNIAHAFKNFPNKAAEARVIDFFGY